MRVALRFNKTKSEVQKLSYKEVLWMYGALKYEQEKLKQSIPENGS